MGNSSRPGSIVVGIVEHPPFEVDGVSYFVEETRWNLITGLSFDLYRDDPDRTLITDGESWDEYPGPDQIADAIADHAERADTWPEADDGPRVNYAATLQERLAYNDKGLSFRIDPARPFEVRGATTTVTFLYDGVRLVAVDPLDPTRNAQIEAQATLGAVEALTLALEAHYSKHAPGGPADGQGVPESTVPEQAEGQPDGDQDDEADEDERERVECKFCHQPSPRDDAYRHDNGWVGECCWDERLRATE